MLLFRLSKISSALKESGAMCTGVERTDIQFIWTLKGGEGGMLLLLRMLIIWTSNVTECSLSALNERTDAAGTAKPVSRDQTFIYERG